MKYDAYREPYPLSSIAIIGKDSSITNLEKSLILFFLWNYDYFPLNPWGLKLELQRAKLLPYPVTTYSCFLIT
jgi:hypothetical protein